MTFLIFTLAFVSGYVLGYLIGKSQDNKFIITYKEFKDSQDQVKFKDSINKPA